MKLTDYEMSEYCKKFSACELHTFDAKADEGETATDVIFGQVVRADDDSYWIPCKEATGHKLIRCLAKRDRYGDKIQPVERRQQSCNCKPASQLQIDEFLAAERQAEEARQAAARKAQAADDFQVR